MRAVEQVISRHHMAPGREPALELLVRLGVAVTPTISDARDIAPCDADTIVMEAIR